MERVVTGPLARRRITKQAGASAAREYERRKRAWRASKRRWFAGLAAVVAVIVVGTLIAAWPYTWEWSAGLFAGAAITLYLFARESPPPWIENYFVGAAGEERTARALAPLLGRGWVVRHDLNGIKSNLDHVIVGPGGVFVLDTKNLHGSVSVDGDVLSLTRPGEGRVTYAHDKLAHAARRQAVDLNRLVKQRCGISPWVSAAVVVWADFPQRIADGRNMSYVHGDALVDWLEAQPARLNTKQVEQITAALEPGQRRRPPPTLPSHRHPAMTLHATPPAHPTQPARPNSPRLTARLCQPATTDHTSCICRVCGASPALARPVLAERQLLDVEDASYTRASPQVGSRVAP